MKKEIFWLVAAVVGFIALKKYLLPMLQGLQSAATINAASQPAPLQTTDPTLTSILSIG